MVDLSWNDPGPDTEWLDDLELSSNSSNSSKGGG